MTNIVVAYKWVANPQDAQVGADGTVDWSRAKAAVSEYDPVALTVGRELADASGQELIGISVGESAVGSPMARKAALSHGLDRALVVADDEAAGLDSSRIAAALAQLVDKVGDVSLLLTGDSSVDKGNRITPALIAGYLGWPCIEEAQAVRIDGGQIEVDRVADGQLQTLVLDGPAVLSVAPDALTPKIPGMKDILAAGKKPMDVLALADVDLSVVTASRTITGAKKPPAPARKNQIIDAADAATAAQQLVDALRADSVL